MAKSTILKDLATNKVSLEVALSRLMIIASDIDDDELRKWATKELNGYNKEDECPPYRLIAPGNIIYSGIKGHLKITDASLPVEAFPTEHQNILRTSIPVKDSLASITNIVENKQQFGTDLTNFASAVYKAQGIQCISINMVFCYTQYNEILSSLRTKLLNIFIELDKRLGNLDDLDIDTQNVDLNKLKQITYNIIYQNNSVELGDNNKVSKSGLFGGSSDGG